MRKTALILASAIVALASCRPTRVTESQDFPPIFPDCIGVTIPENMAEQQFKMCDGRRFSVEKNASGDTLWYKVTAWDKNKAISYRPFPVFISHDPIDPYITYRLIEPGYENWHDMGIYQRELASYSETPLVTNQANNRGCVNCHACSPGDPSTFLFHARGTGGGTVFVNDSGAKLINLTKVGAKMQGVYPAWHPSGRYVAFSSNKTFQAFTVNDIQPIEVFDAYSDLILMDLQTDSTMRIAGAAEPGKLETFPTWSPDGDTLYWCSADGDTIACEDRSKVHYSLKAKDFKDGEFSGEVRTVWQEDSASISLPRVKGDWLLYTRSAYGTFPIWHKEADLWLLNLRTGEDRPAAELNSEDTESYHSWSSNGRWVVFSSRRIDGRYTRLYLAHFDGEGKFGKPFLLPQKKPDYNQFRMQSYNIPEFMTGKVPDHRKEIKKLFAK